jgi:hypothetical protein
VKSSYSTSISSISRKVQEYKRVKESHISRLQLKGSSRYKKIEEKSVEARTSDIG